MNLERQTYSEYETQRQMKTSPTETKQYRIYATLNNERVEIIGKDSDDYSRILVLTGRGHTRYVPEADLTPARTETGKAQHSSMPVCEICGRTEVDAMTLNSIPVNRKMCYRSETGNDPRCKASSKAQHSPLPWYAHEGSGYVMRSEPGTVERIADCTGTGRPDATQAANTKLIVRAVNHADKLAEALRRILHSDAASKIAYGCANEAEAALAAYERSAQ